MPRCLVAADMSPVGEELTTIGSSDCLCSNPHITENMMCKVADKHSTLKTMGPIVFQMYLLILHSVFVI